MYDESDLINMCIEEGYENDEIRLEGAYSLLQENFFLPTFFHGKQGKVTNEETTMLDEINELEYDNVIVYGIRNQDMTAYTYGELKDAFSVTKRFQQLNRSGDIFSDISIKKLYKLCQKDQRIGEKDVIFYIF